MHWLTGLFRTRIGYAVKATHPNTGFSWIGGTVFPSRALAAKEAAECDAHQGSRETRHSVVEVRE